MVADEGIQAANLDYGHVLTIVNPEHKPHQSEFSMDRTRIEEIKYFSTSNLIAFCVLLKYVDPEKLLTVDKFPHNMWMC